MEIKHQGVEHSPGAVPLPGGPGAPPGESPPLAWRSGGVLRHPHGELPTSHEARPGKTGRSPWPQGILAGRSTSGTGGSGASRP
eukprot:171905-Alexandrium_andersonii.AAC.2